MVVEATLLGVEAPNLRRNRWLNMRTYSESRIGHEHGPILRYPKPGVATPTTSWLDEWYMNGDRVAHVWKLWNGLNPSQER